MEGFAYTQEADMEAEEVIVRLRECHPLEAYELAIRLLRYITPGPRRQTMVHALLQQIPLRPEFLPIMHKLLRGLPPSEREWYALEWIKQVFS